MSPPSKVRINLDFVKPFEAQQRRRVHVGAEGRVHERHLGMHGPSPFFAKVMRVFFNMDEMVGKDFERSWNLKGSPSDERWNAALGHADTAARSNCTSMHNKGKR